MNDCVLWQGTGEPPPLLSAHLRMHGLALITQPGAQDHDVAAPWPARRISLLDVLTPPISGRAALLGRRIALIQPDPGRADSLAQALRARGAEVVALGLAHEAFQRAELLDPDVVLVEPEYFYGDECWPLVEAVWRHVRLRWATILLMPPEALDGGGLSLPDVRPLCAAIQMLAAPVEQLRMLSKGCEHFDFQLDRLGPARTLRVLVDTLRTLRAEIDAPGVSLEVDVAKELVIGARGERDRPGTQVERLFGPHALSVCVGLAQGQIAVRSVQHPAVANVMAPFDSALYLATQAPEPAEETTNRQHDFEESPTRPWDDGFLGPSTHYDPMEVIDVPLSAPPPPMAPEPELSTNVAVLRMPEVQSMAARAPVNTLPIPLPAWKRRMLPAAILGGAAVGAALWLIWPRAVPEPTATVSIGALRPTPAQRTDEPMRGAQAPAPRPPTVAPAAAPEAAASADHDEVTAEEAREAPPEPRTRGHRAIELVNGANALQERGMYTEARGKYFEALELAPGLPRALSGLARLAIARRDADEAVKYARELTQKRPGQAAYHLLLGDAYRLAQKAGSARIAYRTAARLGSAKAKARLAER